MTPILSIDTSLEQAFVALSDGPRILSFESNDRQMAHAGWIHTAIQRVLASTGLTTAQLSAVAVAAGPGSYTGLRVGMATAKGICYAANLPLIAVSTLQLIADASGEGVEETTWICPMIDARRMEVFTALYDRELEIRREPDAIVLTPHAFDDVLDRRPVVFCGSGTAKWRSICAHPSAIFSSRHYSVEHLVRAADMNFNNRRFADLAYAEPTYLKNAYTGEPASNK